MPIAHVASVSAVQGASGGTTGAFNTTGASLIVVSVPTYLPFLQPTVSDNKGNTYVQLSSLTQSPSLRHTLYYTVGSLTVGTGHTITVTPLGGTSIYNSVVAHAFSGVASYHSENNTIGTTSPLSTGSVTPSVNGSLVFTALGNETAGPVHTIPSGFTAGIDVPYGSGVNFGTATAYLVQTTAAAINPQWSWTGTHAAAIAAVAVFLPSVTSTAEGRISQLPLETLILSNAPISTNISQLPLETLILSDAPIQLRVSQLPIEVLIDPSIIPIPPTTETVQFVIIV
jgi:hypothetical protein